MGKVYVFKKKKNCDKGCVILSHTYWCTFQDQICLSTVGKTANSHGDWINALQELHYKISPITHAREKI